MFYALLRRSDITLMLPLTISLLLSNRYLSNEDLFIYSTSNQVQAGTFDWPQPTWLVRRSARYANTM